MTTTELIEKAPCRAALLDAFSSYVSSQRGLSSHTDRAYRSDIEALLGFSVRHGARTLDDIDLRMLRAWLAAQAAAKRSRATLARRGAAARTFLAWAARTDRIAVDPSLRLATARVGAPLPTVLRTGAVTAMIDAARERAADGEAAHVRDWALLELLYATGIRVGELCSADLRDVEIGRAHV